MSYFFNLLPLVNQYQPYYGFLPQFYLENKPYYFEEPNLPKQETSQKENISLFEPQIPSKLINEAKDDLKKPKKLKKKQDKNFGFRDQNKERNIFSNILKGFFLAFTQKRVMDSFIQEFLPQSQSSRDGSIQEFIKKVSKIFSKCKSYFSPKSVRQILKLQKDEENVRLIVQKCLYRYLKTQFPITLLLSKRIKRRSKLLQIKKSRELLSMLRETQ